MEKMQEILAKEPAGFLQWLESPQGLQFNELLEEWLQREENKLHDKKASIEELRFAQGALYYMGLIYRLAPDIRSYLSDIKTGKRKPVEIQKEVGTYGMG